MQEPDTNLMPTRASYLKIDEIKKNPKSSSPLKKTKTTIKQLFHFKRKMLRFYKKTIWPEVFQSIFCFAFAAKVIGLN